MSIFDDYNQVFYASTHAMKMDTSISVLMMNIDVRLLNASGC